MLPSSVTSPEQPATGYTRIQRRQFLSVATVCLIGAIVALFVGTGFLARQVEGARESMALRAELISRGQQLQAVISLLQDAEAGQRGLLLTHKRSYLLPYAQAVRELPEILRETHAASADDAQVTSHIKAIERLAELKMTELAETIRLHDSGDQARALEVVQTDRGKQYMEELRSEMELALKVLHAQGKLAEVQLIEEMLDVKRWAWWTVIALTTAIAMATYQLRSLGKLRAKVETELRTQTAILNTVVDEMPAILGVWDRDCRYRLVNKAFEHWRGRKRETIIGRSIAEIIGEDEYQRSRSWIDRALAGEAVSYEKEYLKGNEKNEVRHISVNCSPLFAEDGSVTGVVSIAQDVTDHREERAALKRLSERDSLTKLLNRAAFETWLTAQCKVNGGQALAVLYIDLDHFKPINDEHGHATGDAVLREFAKRLQASIRPSDAAARLGGDEFAIGLCGIHAHADAQRVADKLLAETARPMQIDSLALQVAASIGVAVDASLQGSWKGLIARADQMVYRAKRSGRGRSHMKVGMPAAPKRAP